MTFTISSEDVINVLAQQGLQVDERTAQILLDDHLSEDVIEVAALSVVDRDTRTEVAYGAILKQLTQGGHLEVLRAQHAAVHLEGFLPTATLVTKPRM